MPPAALFGAPAARRAAAALAEAGLRPDQYTFLALDVTGADSVAALVKTVAGAVDRCA